MIYFSKKGCALKQRRGAQIVCNDNITRYFVLEGYMDFRKLIEDTESPCYYEFIQESAPVKLFLDIEIYKSKQMQLFETHIQVMHDILRTLATNLVQTNHTKMCQNTFIVLESHSETKKSYHVIVQTFTSDNRPLAYPCVKSLKGIIQRMFPELVQQKVIDTSVYREGLFRTYLSSKSGEYRPLVASDLSDPFDFTDTFVCHFTEPPELIVTSNTVVITQSPVVVTPGQVMSTPYELTSQDKIALQHFLRLMYAVRLNDIRDYVIDTIANCIVIALHDKFCYNVQREHKSNHQYILIDNYSAKQRCHDTDCSSFRYNEIKADKYPVDVLNIIKKCLRVTTVQEQELVDQATSDCKRYINENFDNIEDIHFDKSALVFRGEATDNSLMRVNGQCPKCNLEHQITGDGYCVKCRVCNSVFPRNQLIPVDTRFKELQTFWNNYTNLINNGTVNITVNYNNTTNNFDSFDDYESYECDVSLNEDIFKNNSTTKLFNQILDGHKITKIGELLKRIEVDFKYTNGNWYYFNGSIWKHDKETLELRKKIVKITNFTHQIKSHYEVQRGEQNAKLVKSVKGLANKFHRPGFQDEIIKGAKMYFNDESFIKNLNKKKHLFPFTNGVYDLLENKFRKTRKDDYICLTTEYSYDERARNPEVYTFLEQILPCEPVRNFVLKKMSDCLNGDIPNTAFLMFIGDSGANGKSQLLNLMKASMGELGEKVEVTLLTRKRNNANEANTEKVKLMNKRFAFLSEPEDGEKINIGLLKELTGSEEIVARGLYQESVSFVMEAKLFLACNELPEIKGEDTALWRRIRVVDFPSRFVDCPREPGEFKIDRDIPSKIRENVSWRQTFINILLDFYYRDVPEPEEVKVKTSEYRQENSDFYNWLSENVQEDPNKFLKLKDICEMFLSRTRVAPRDANKIRKEVEKFIKDKFPGVNWKYQDSTFNCERYKGWARFTLRDLS